MLPRHQIEPAAVHVAHGRLRFAGKCLLMWCLASVTGCADEERPNFGIYPIRMWYHSLDRCSVSVSVDDVGNVKSDRSCDVEESKITVGRFPGGSLQAFRDKWFESVEKFRRDVGEGKCAGNQHNFYTDGGSTSTGLYRVCGAGGELLDARGLPTDLQMLITEMLNAAQL